MQFNIILDIIRMSFACHSYVLLCHSYTIECHPYVTRMPSVCHSYVLVCHSYLLVCYRMPLICTCLLLVCHSYVLVYHLYVTRMYSYVIRMSLVHAFTMNPIRSFYQRKCNMCPVFKFIFGKACAGGENLVPIAVTDIYCLMCDDI